MKQRIGRDATLARFFIYDYDFPHPVGPFESIAAAHNQLVEFGKQIKAKEAAENSQRGVPEAGNSRGR